MVGFFSSEALAALAPGLAAYINRSGDRFRLIISPFIRPQDQAAIEAGSMKPDSVAADALDPMIVTEDRLQQHTLRCLSYLLRTARIEIRIALLKNGLFHPKVWMFTAGPDAMAVHGSSNMTYAGITTNFEQITVSKSWEDPNQKYIAEKLAYQFARLWDNKEDDCLVISLPQAIKERLLRTYASEAPPTETEFRELYQRAARFPRDNVTPPAVSTIPSPKFTIPALLSYDSGPFEHQGRAVRAWCDGGFRGVLEMATGSGKTITAMICAHKAFALRQPLLIVIAAPYVPLIEQWCDEVEPFGLKPINLTTEGSASQRSRSLNQVGRRLRMGISTVEAIVVSHDTLCSAELFQDVEAIQATRLLIADEVHNLGRPSFISKPPDFFEHRLGLSATPIRQYDPDGTDALFAFFGPVVFQFTLQEAIGRCLVEYDYHVHPVYLADDEMDQWYELTSQIKQNAWRQNDEKGKDYLAKLLRDRRALLETARGKIRTLTELLDREDPRGLRHTLIYASDKEPGQLLAVNHLLQDKGILFHQLTATETADRYETKRIIRSFQDGEIQVLTAKRVLDEGVNIPQVCKAYILASTTVERQWIQRRGRLLRMCSAIGKTHSTIHDLLALPPGMEAGLDPDARGLVRSELHRAQEFASLARNAGRPDGSLRLIDRLVDAAHL